MSGTVLVLTIVIACLSSALIAFAVHVRHKEVDLRLSALEKEIDDIKQKRQNHRTRAGLMDAHALLNKTERELVDMLLEMESGSAAILKYLERISAIYGVLLHNPNDYPKDARFDKK